MNTAPPTREVRRENGNGRSLRSRAAGPGFRNARLPRHVPWKPALVLCLGMLLMGAGGLHGATTNEASATTSSAEVVRTNALVTLDGVMARLSAISNRTDLSTQVRTNAMALYAEAEQRLTEANRHLEDAQRFHRETTNAPALAAELQATLAAPLPTPSLSVASNAPAVELEQLLAQKESELSLAVKASEALAQEPARRTARAAELTVLIAAARGARDRVLQELAAPAAGELDPVAYQAARDLQLARQQFREAELLRYEEESNHLNATAEVVRLRLDASRRRVAILTQERDLVLNTLNRRRGQETLQATARAEQAQRRAELLNEPALSRLASTNAALARERATLAERLRATSSRLEAVNTNLATQRAQFQGVRARVEAASKAGLRRNYAIGVLLRRQQAYLEGLGNHRRQARQEQAAVSGVQIAQFAALDARRALEPIGPAVETLLQSLPPDTDPDRLKRVGEEAELLLGEQHELLTALVRDHDTEISLLLRLHTALEESAVLVDEFTAYLSQRILWIRSLGALDGTALRHELAVMRSVLTSPDWGPSLRGLGVAIRGTAFSTAIVAAGVALLIALQPRLRRRLDEESAVARQGRNTRIEPTFRAIICTFLLALPVPLTLALVGWRCLGGAVADNLPLLGHLGRALLMAAVALFVWDTLRQVFRPDGLAVAHFRMAEEDAALLRRSMTRYVWLVPLLGAVNELFEREPVEGASNRLTFILTTFAFSAFAHVVLRPTGGVGSETLGEFVEAAGKRWWRRFVHLLAVVLPLLVAVASVLGYNYSARQLWMRFLASVLVILCLQLLSSLLLRWVYLVRRRLAMAHAEKLRSEEETAAAAGTAEGPRAASDETQAELLTWLEQARRLLRWTAGLALLGCLWGIWSGVLPAIQALDAVPVWSLDPGDRAGTAAPDESNSAKVLNLPLAGVGAAPPGETEMGGAPTGRFVSIWDLLIVLLILLVTIMASRNLPGFLEMAVFSHLRFERGEGYAITTTLRYLIVLVGLFLAARGLGIAWTKVQWLAAAVTVGIGFGLQEIFANFVSGLILLFERPLRVGDVVTVGDVSGMVSRIQIRATTIRDWDNRELVLPNKTLITGGFLNWTLSDSITRILCKVGISYDADPRQAQALMLEVARKHPSILSEPAPIVAFEGFGESTLDLSLRAHVSRTEQRASTTFDLHVNILEAFRKAGIEIAFPQRDLHVRTLPSALPTGPLAPGTPLPAASPSRSEPRRN